MNYKISKRLIIYTIGLPFLLPIWITSIVGSPLIVFLALTTSESWNEWNKNFWGFYKWIFTGDL